MRPALLSVLSTLLLLACTTLVGASAASAQPEAERRYIVVYKDWVQASAKTAALERTHRFTSSRTFVHALNGFAASLSDRARAEVAADPDVLFVSEDRRVSIAALKSRVRSGEEVPAGVSRTGATATVSGRLVAHKKAGVAVAVLDTGVDLANKDLDARHGVDCVYGAKKLWDLHGHGTHVAGTVGARNNGRGVIGVAPGTRVYAVKVLADDGYGWDSDIICGIDWVTGNAAKLRIKVANMSLGRAGGSGGNCGLNTNDAYHWAVCRSTAAGVTYVAAAGNEGANLDTRVPAAYPEVLTVTGMADRDGRPGGSGGSFCGHADDTPYAGSNYATTSAALAHTVAAPAVCVRSTLPGGGYASWTGTSMAAPHVAAAVALCIKGGLHNAPCAGMSPAQIIQKIRADAAAQPSGYGFAGDEANSPGSKRYGRLLHTGGY